MSKQLTTVNLAPAKAKIEAMGLDLQAVEREAMYAARLIEANPKIGECEPTSIALAVADAVSVGTTLNPAFQYAYLEPRWDSKLKKNRAHMKMMYRGLQHLAVKAGAATSFRVNVVYSNDKFIASMANPKCPIVHEVASFNRGTVKGVYSLACLPDGTYHVELMTKEEGDAILKMSSSAASKAHPGEFRRKTVVKRHIKRLPFGTTETGLAKAIEIDNAEYQDVTDEPKPVPQLTEMKPGYEHWNTTVRKFWAKEVDVAKIKKHFLLTDENKKLLIEAATAIDLDQEVKALADV